MRRYLISMPLILGVLANAEAVAAVSAQVATTGDLRMRAGPSTIFPLVNVIPGSATVEVHGCVSGYSWCDVSAAGSRGWVYSRFLRHEGGANKVPLLESAPRLGLPIVGFSVESYWNEFYQARPWFSRRSHWRERWRRNWPDRSRNWRAG
jgi:uncharacterized protein YraI